MIKQRFKIGTKFTIKRKNSKQDCTIIDVHKTYNNSNELVKLRYVASHTFLGLEIIDSDITNTTIAIALSR